jgi:hypothetical protein
MSLFANIGFVIKKNYKLKTGEFGIIETSLYGLLALLLAFTFNMASDRYDSRREDLTEETNSIVSTSLCLSLYPDSTKKQLNSLLNDYLKSRIDLYSANRVQTAMKNAIELSNRSSNQMWDLAARFAYLPEYQTVSRLTLQTISDMKSIATRREKAFEERVPDTIMLLLFIMIIICSFYLGFLVQLDSIRSWITIVGFLLFSIMVIYVIIDLDRPQRGLITVESYEKMIEDLRTELVK